ncbi:HK97 family phage prohead protease [Ralstonia pseudosolanacearum]|uniref:HK97 family phage prohead protease n=1 Tax=Ralstonia pseudosolanacearum TaxID=1310165 RepID=UPI002674CF86|nr:HK97 family phage prohead protease [Ralstonia pseudosolanacearum]MDO3527100.1 HK97 family phage prohead protease [Ralstonia pseudosolanacearum]MDO3531705.1 HK97 family phage prohead protease [Ralstonia pseudosolanacearum]
MRVLISGSGRQESAQFSRWFGARLRKRWGIADKRKTFHSFRHTFKDSLREHGVAEDVSDALSGHSINEETREIEGIASTPSLDRVKDSVKPLGLTFAKEVPLLLHHKHAEPVGTTTFGAPTAKGLPFKAKVAKVDEPGTVKDRTDEAWHSVKAKLIKGVSIGFTPLEYEPNKAGGLDFTKAEVHELSLVTIPCNPEAVITAFKSLQELHDDAPASAEEPGEVPQAQQPATPAPSTSEGSEAAPTPQPEAPRVRALLLDIDDPHVQRNSKERLDVGHLHTGSDWGFARVT